MKQSIEVWLYLEESKEVLLLRVSNDQYDFWQPVTGGVELGESYPEAACREVFEETGISILPSDLLYLGQQIIPVSKAVTLDKQAFLVILPTQPEVTISFEHQAFSWRSLTKVEKLLYWPGNQETFSWAVSKIVG